MPNLPKRYYLVLKVFTENKLFCFSKRALYADTARNKWLKEALSAAELLICLTFVLFTLETLY